MDDIHIRKRGRIGQITLNRPKALNALTYGMCIEIEAALDLWVDDDDVAMIVINAHGDRAFCAGGDITEMYASGMRGDFAFGRKFWRDEYRMNAKLANFPKPYVAFMQGFTMGGGVGVSCHGSHRIVCDTSQIAMPECGIGLVPDVGGSLLLAQAPGRLGEYLGSTGTRMNAGDAIYAGFADYYIPEDQWPGLIKALAATGDWGAIDAAAQPSPKGTLAADRPEIDDLFAGETLRDIHNNLCHAETGFARAALKALHRNAPLSMAAAVEMTHRLRGAATIETALELEYRFVSRSMESGDFLEGIRAAIIDKDRTPNWRHSDITAVSAMDVANMLMPMGDKKLKLGRN